MFQPAEWWAAQKFGHLKIKNPEDVYTNSNKKKEWICDCGKTKLIKVMYVFNGNQKTCGECNIKSAEWWASQKFGHLRIKNPEDIHTNSNKKKEWVCDCGRTKSIKVHHVFNGNQKTCGECNTKTTEWWASQKFGHLRIKNPEDMSTSSGKKKEWVCDCGNIKRMCVSGVTSKYRTCGRCNVKSAEWWASQKFGHLRIKNPREFSIWSKKLTDWVCDCGNVKRIKVCLVTDGNTHSCGNCRNNVRVWYERNIELIKSLTGVIKIGDFPAGGIIPLEDIQNTKSPFLALCPACGSTYRPRLESIKQGVCLTCGCCSNIVSTMNRNVSDFVNRLGLRTELEFKINDKKFDICVQDRNLLIEMNGLRWHSDSKARDLLKYKIAMDSGYQFMMVFEDEWRKKRLVVENIIKNRLGVNDCIKFRPKQCEIMQISDIEANVLYESYHYIGSCQSKISYGVFYDRKLIGAMSFRRPSRQTSNYEYEISRMVMNPAYKIHGIWTKILNMFIHDVKPESIVTFSDNRLFTGIVYANMGFKFDGDVKPDYYWVRHGNRFHKSKLRKPAKCSITESELRISEGYNKVWDLGKKRWVMKVTSCQNSSNMAKSSVFVPTQLQNKLQ